MKTLDEVIKAYEYCIDNNYRDCRGCPYGCEDGESCCHDAEEKKDALHYLKEYQKIEDEYDELKDWWAEEHAKNVPLSWDELKRMIGKPVFITSRFFSSQWYIVYSCHDDIGNIQDFSALKGIDYNGHCLSFSKKDIGGNWKAYRKERS